MRRLAVVILLAAAPSRGAGAQAACTSPTPGRTWRSDSALDSNRYQWPASPALAASFRPRQLAGRFRLTLAVTAGGSDTTLVGHMTLRPTPREFPQPQDSAVSTPLIGATDLPFDRIGPLTLAGPPSNDIPGLPPGVLLQWTLARRAILLIGSGEGYDGMIWEDSGVLLYVFRVDGDHVAGRWESGGLLVSTKDGEPHRDTSASTAFAAQGRHLTSACSGGHGRMTPA